MLTIETNNPIWHEKQGEEHQKEPTSDFHHPSTMVDTITGILLTLDTNHHNKQDGEEQKIPQAYTKHGLGLKPLPIRYLMKMINPRINNQTTLHQNSHPNT